MFKSTLYEETHPSSVDFRCKDSKKFLITQINLYFVVILLLLAQKTHFSCAYVIFARFPVPSKTMGLLMLPALWQ